MPSFGTIVDIFFYGVLGTWLVTYIINELADAIIKIVAKWEHRHDEYEYDDEDLTPETTTTTV